MVVIDPVPVLTNCEAFKKFIEREVKFMDMITDIEWEFIKKFRFRIEDMKIDVCRVGSPYYSAACCASINDYMAGYINVNNNYALIGNYPVIIAMMLSQLSCNDSYWMMQAFLIWAKMEEMKAAYNKFKEDVRDAQSVEATLRLFGCDLPVTPIKDILK